MHDVFHLELVLIRLLPLSQTIDLRSLVALLKYDTLHKIFFYLNYYSDCKFSINVTAINTFTTADQITIYNMQIVQ